MYRHATKMPKSVSSRYKMGHFSVSNPVSKTPLCQFIFDTKKQNVLSRYNLSFFEFPCQKFFDTDPFLTRFLTRKCIVTIHFFKKCIVTIHLTMTIFRGVSSRYTKKDKMYCHNTPHHDDFSKVYRHATPHASHFSKVYCHATHLKGHIFC